MIAIIDNYDSFTYNVYQMIGQLDPDIRVFRNDAISVLELAELKPDRLIISPGPGFPSSAGISVQAIQALYGSMPMLGICLGHQAMVEAFGGKVVHADKVMHGKSSQVLVDDDCPIFSGLPESIEAGRYHSLMADTEILPECLKITAKTEDGTIMGIKHKEYPMFGVQFHPESVLTPLGVKIFSNFLDRRE